MSWEYEGLFEEIPEENSILGSWWRDEQTAIRVGSMGYRTRTTRAGARLDAEIYPIFGREMEKKAKRARGNLTPERQQKVNERRSRQYFVQLVEANFGEGDIHLTLTYREAPKYDRAKKDIRNFLLKVKRLRERRGLEELKYAGTIEENEEGRKVRIHAHILMNGGIDREELEAIWEKGLTNVFGLQPDERGLEGIARYVTKQQKNQKKWFRSRNLKKPERRTSDTKVSTRRVKRISLSFGAEAKEILEKVYPGYRFVQCTVHYSDVVDGVYIRCEMRKIGGQALWTT